MTGIAKSVMLTSWAAPGTPGGCPPPGLMSLPVSWPVTAAAVPDEVAPLPGGVGSALAAAVVGFTSPVPLPSTGAGLGLAIAEERALRGAANDDLIIPWLSI